MIKPRHTFVSVVKDLVQRLSDRSMVLHRITSPHVIPLNLWDLNSKAYTLRQSVVISIEQWSDNEFTAHWHDVEAVGHGEGQQQAIDGLCESIIDLHEGLRQTPDENLGKMVLKAKQILSAVIIDNSSYD